MKVTKSEHITLDRIRAWLNDPNAPELTEKDREIYNRWDYCYDQLKVEKPVAVVRRLMLKFGISKPQAYVDIENCQKLLNPINRRDLEWIRNFIVDDAILQMQVAKQRLDLKAWEKASATLLKIYALEKEDKSGIDPELLGNNQYFVAINFGDKVEKIDLDKLHKLPVDKRVNLTKFLFEDIEIEDAKEIMES